MGLKYGVAITDTAMSAEGSMPLRGKLTDSICTAARLGFDGVEINVDDPTKVDTKLIKRSLSDNGIVACAAITGLSIRPGCTLIADDATSRRYAVETLKRYVDFVAELNAVMVIGCYRGFIPPTDQPWVYVERFKQGVIEVAEYALKQGVVIVLEAVNMYFANYLNSAREMDRFVREINMPNIQLHLDSTHMFLHDFDVYSRIKASADKLAYVHLSDSDRYACGTGNINFAEYIRGLRDIDYKGFSTIEVVPYPNGERAADVSIRYLKMLEECYEMKYMEQPGSNFPRAFF